MSRRLLSVLRVSPILIGVLLAAVWFSVPAGLRTEMLEMTAAGVPERATVAGDTDRRSAAEAFLVDAARERASRDWPDVRFAEVARRSAGLVPDEVDEACRQGRAAEHMIAADDPSLAGLRSFAEENPDAQVHAYLVPQPAMPAVVMSMTASPDDLRPDEYDRLWQGLVGSPASAPFDPDAWRGPGMVMDTASPELWSYLSRTEAFGLVKAFVFGVRNPPDVVIGSVPGLDPERSDHVHDPFSTEREKWVDTDMCAACHVIRTSDDGSVHPERAGHTMLAGGPVELRALTQYSTEPDEDAAAHGARLLEIALATTDTVYVRLPDAGGDGAAKRWGTLVWQVPESPSYGQTMLYSCTFDGDPHAEFEASLARAPGRQIRQARAWLAVNLSGLLATLGTLLAASLLAVPVAYVVELRIETRRRSEEELARIQRDAHDRVYNRLTALSQRVDEAANGLPQEASAGLDSVGGDIRSTVANLQSILEAGGKSAASDKDVSLLAQLEAVSAAQASLHGIEVSFEAAAAAPVVPARLGWDLQCVLEEAITNAVKHGRASNVAVTLASEAGCLHLTVADDGTGFAEADAGGRASTGLAGMRARLTAWGGSVTVSDGADGAVLVVDVPVA